MAIGTDLSLTALAALNVIVRNDDVALEQILREVPTTEELYDVAGAVQELLDRGLVIRVEGRDQFLYRSTVRGAVTLRAFIHPTTRVRGAASA